MKTLLAVLLGILLIIFILIWIGLRTTPRSFPAFSSPAPSFTYVDLPDDLPPPVKGYYEQIYGDQIPVIETAVLSGRADLRINGLNLPGRFRFFHNAGRDYKHYIEVTFLGFPVLRINEFYRDGISRMELPGNLTENEPKINQAANLGLWAESIWLPAIYLTDERVRWEAIDAHSARLIVPFEDLEESLLVTFDPDTGLPATLEAMRYREVWEEHKIRWHNEVLDWQEINGFSLPATGSVRWMDQEQPWAIFKIDEVVYNAEVAALLESRGLGQ